MVRKRLSQVSLLAAGMALFLSLVIQMLIPLKTFAAGNGGTVTFSMERFTLGQGYLVEPVEVPFNEGDTGYDILMRAIPNAQKVLHFKDKNTYLAWVEGADLGLDQIAVPDYIFGLSGSEFNYETMREYGNSYPSKGLGEFSYSSWSGWMYSVNHEFPEYGLAAYQPKNGDVIRWQFTLYGTGLDVKGKSFGETELRVPISNKDEATKLLAKVNKDPSLLSDSSVKWAYEQLKKLVQNPVSPQENVNQSVQVLGAALEGRANIFPKTIVLDQNEKEVYCDSGSFKLAATIDPSDAMMNEIKWSSNAPEIAEVTSDGTVMPKKGGSAQIIAETGNGLKASCTVTVKERPITELVLNPTELKIVKGNTAQINTIIRPENTTDRKELSWESSQPEIATVENGIVSAITPGETLITVQTVNGIKAETRVRVEEDYEKLIQNLKSAIAAIPDVSAITLNDEEAILNAQAVYIGLPHEYRDQLTPEERSKLEAANKVLQTLKDDQKKVEEFSEKVNALLNVNQITVGDNDSVRSLVNIVNTYNGLTAVQQNQVKEKTDVYKKYEQCLTKHNELKDIVMRLNQQLEALSPLVQNPKDFNLGNIAQVTEARTDYNKLCPYLMDIEKDQSGWIDQSAASLLMQAEKLVRSVFVTEIRALDITDEASVVRFIHAMKIYEGIPSDQRPNFNETVTEQMLAGQSHIAAKYQKNDEVTVSGNHLPWNIKAVISEVKGDKQLEKAISTLYGEGSTLKKAFTVTFEDIETGTPYEPEGELKFSVSYQNGFGEKAENYRIFKQDPLSKSSGLLEKMATIKELTDIKDPMYDEKCGIWQFSTTAPCTFGIVYRFIPLTGVAVEGTTEIEEGTGMTLSVRPVPENATLGDKGLQVVWSSSDSAAVSVNEKGEVKGLKAGQSAVITAAAKDHPEIKGSFTVKVKTGAAVQSLRESLNPSMQQMLQETANYVVTREFEEEQKQAGSIGYASQWNVLAVARAKEIATGSGMDTSRWDQFIKTFYNNAAGQYKKDGGIIEDGERKRTEYSKFILALTACGYDAREVSEAKYNVFDHLRDFSDIKAQGVNGPIWALIALKCSDKYQGVLPTTEAEAASTEIKNPTSEEKLVNFVLDTQLANGGWALHGKVADSDMTGMALQSLWPYYLKADSEKTAFEKSVSSRVNTAVERALKCLKDIQMETAGYGSFAGGSLQETSESIDQVVVGLTGLGIDPADGKFGYVKPGNQWMMSALARYYVSGGGFMHLLPGSGSDGGAKPGELNGMATEQGFYTLVAYQRFAEGKNGLYNMNDEKIKGGQAADGEVTTGKKGLQNSGKQTAKGGGAGVGKAGAKKGNGWNFDTTMAASERAKTMALNEARLKNASVLLGLCGLGIIVIFIVIRTIYGIVVKP